MPSLRKSHNNGSLIINSNKNYPLVLKLKNQSEKREGHKEIKPEDSKPKEASKEEAKPSYKNDSDGQKDVVIGQVLNLLKSCNEQDLVDIISKKLQKDKELPSIDNTSTLQIKENLENQEKEIVKEANEGLRFFIYFQ